MRGVVARSVRGIAGESREWVIREGLGVLKRKTA